MNINMKHYLCFLAILAVVHCELQPGFRARFGNGGVEEVDETNFFSLPRNVTQAVSFGWSETVRPEGPLSSLVMYCPETPTVCVLFDDAEYAAGVQVALNKSQISDAILDWSTQGFTSWTTEDGTEYWTQQEYFVDEEYLAKSKEDRIASRKANDVLQLDSIWVTGQDGELVRISRSREDIEKSIFTKQACYRRMGMHYFYNMTTSTECTSRGLYPWFVMTGSDRLIASTFCAAAKYPTPSGREWFDVKGNAELLKQIVPNGPECFYNLDILTVHIYYVEEPWTITCPTQ